METASAKLSYSKSKPSNFSYKKYETQNLNEMKVKQLVSES